MEIARSNGAAVPERMEDYPQWIQALDRNEWTCAECAANWPGTFLEEQARVLEREGIVLSDSPSPATTDSHAMSTVDSSGRNTARERSASRASFWSAMSGSIGRSRSPAPVSRLETRESGSRSQEEPREAPLMEIAQDEPLPQGSASQEMSTQEPREELSLIHI